MQGMPFKCHLSVISVSSVVNDLVYERRLKSGAGCEGVEGLLEGDADVGDAGRVEDEDVLAVGDLDRVVGLVGDEDRVLDDETGCLLGHVVVGDESFAVAVELFEDLA